MLAAMPPTPPVAESRPGASDRDRGGASAAGREAASGPDRDRGDACPGALRLHRADDGALARVRLPGGLLTAAQALALADAAERLGDGRLELTSRGNVQLRGLAEDAGAELGALLRAAGLLPSETHERVRNVIASPLSGLDGLGSADVRAWARELDALLCASPPAAGLAGLFLFVLDDGRGDVASLDADVTLIATPGGGALLRLGRAATARRVAPGTAPAAALAAAEEFLTAVRAAGVKAWFVREAAQLLDPGAEPLPVFAGGAPELGPFGGGVVAGTRFGSVTAAQWRALAGACAGELRITPWRSVVLPGATAVGELAAAGLRLTPGSPWELATACTGAPGCAKSLADVRADAARALETAGVPGLPVHWSGCERRCGHPAGEWVDVLATGSDMYRVTNHRISARTTHDLTMEQMAQAVAEARRTN
ncbi:cobalamin biosynthesis protein CobG [Kitasatospora sp. NPDC051853]|uniref:cobalamin biosynthesis protein CobG n=1 Tax=Kitasatospora sp. NPDC051853 TaxID=3364058 RepID=UPI0037879011